MFAKGYISKLSKEQKQKRKRILEGTRPVFRRLTYDRRALSTAVALTPSGRIYKRYFGGSIKSEQIIEILQNLQKHVPVR